MGFEKPDLNLYYRIRGELDIVAMRRRLQGPLQSKKNKPMAPTILERGLPICGLRPNHVCAASR
jgi:hypothetical protein